MSDLPTLDKWRWFIDDAEDDERAWELLLKVARQYAQLEGYFAHQWRYLDLMRAAPSSLILEAVANESWPCGWSSNYVFQHTYDRQRQELGDASTSGISEELLVEPPPLVAAGSDEE